MNSMIKKVAVTGAAAVAAVGIGIAPASAASVTVSGGPSFTSVSTNSVLTSGSITISCTRATASGTVTAGGYSTPAEVGSITSSAWGSAAGGSCSAFGLPATVTQNGTWQLWATSGSSGGLTQVEIRNIDATVQVPDFGCTVSVTGTAPGTWSNASQALTFTGGALSTTGSGFCLGLGSTGSMSGNFSVTGSPSAITIAPPPPPAPDLTVLGGPSFTSVSTNSTLTSGSVTIPCTRATASGSITAGSYKVPARIGSITNTAWGAAAGGVCDFFGGVPITWTQNGTWQLWATGKQSGGVTPVEIRNVNATGQAPSLGCTITVSGTAPGTWNNSQVLTFTGGSLSTSGSGFCLGLGSTGSMSGSFSVTGSPSPITVL